MINWLNKESKGQCLEHNHQTGLSLNNQSQRLGDRVLLRGESTPGARDAIGLVPATWNEKGVGVGGFPKENQAVVIRKNGGDGCCTVKNSIYLPQWALYFSIRIFKFFNRCVYIASVIG